MNARDELADEIAGHPIGSGYYSASVGMDEAREIADAILAAGYMKPRTVMTAEGLDALPQGSAVLTANGYVYIAERHERHGCYTILWKGLGVGSFSHLWFEKSGSLPVIVLWEPTA